jgi:peroxiredoxin
MTTNLRFGDTFPDFELPDYRKQLQRLSRFTKPSLLDEKIEA